MSPTGIRPNPMTTLILLLLLVQIFLTIIGIHNTNQHNRKTHKIMSQLDDNIQALQATVAAENTVIDSAVALINGFAQQLADAIAAALAAGATPEELQNLTDLNTAVTAKSAELAAAVQSGTPAKP